MTARAYADGYVYEDVVVLDPTTIVVLNDNNYPATGGRGKQVKDPNEFPVIRLDKLLKCWAAARANSMRSSPKGAMFLGQRA